MSERIVRLVVEAKVDAERPELCADDCPARLRDSGGFMRCYFFDDYLDTRARLPECLAAESQPEEKP